MFPIATLLTLAAYVAADQTFSLTAVGDTVNFPVQLDNDRLVLNAGSGASFNLEEPAGYVSAIGRDNEQYLTSTPQYGLVLRDKGDASSAWGFIDGHLRLNAGNVNSFYACPNGDEGTSYYISGTPCNEGGEQVNLNIDGAVVSTSSEAPATSSETPVEPSSEAPADTTSEAPVEPTSEAPTNGTTTEEHTLSTLVTITSCSDEVCTSSAVPPSVSPENGGAQAKIAAGALAAAAALLL